MRSASQPMGTPNEIEFLEVFGVEPLDANPAEGMWMYELRDSDGLSLRFSYSTFDRSIQAVLLMGERELARISQEGARFISLGDDSEGPVLRARLEFGDAHADLEIRTLPALRMSWATLVDRG